MARVVATDDEPEVLGPLVVGLRRYALGLTGDLARADDLVRDALACAHAAGARREEPDARLRLYAILVDCHRSRVRARPRWSLLTRGFFGERGSARGSDSLRTRDLGNALAAMGDDDRRALILVVLERFSYADVAKIEGITTEAVVRRIGSARAKLSAMLDAAAREAAPRAFGSGKDPIACVPARANRQAGQI